MKLRTTGFECFYHFVIHRAKAYPKVWPAIVEESLSRHFYIIDEFPNLLGCNLFKYRFVCFFATKIEKVFISTKYFGKKVGIIRNFNILPQAYISSRI